MTRVTPKTPTKQLLAEDALQLPSFTEDLESLFNSGKSLKVDGTNVVRVPFGIRHSRKQRPERPERWATLVIPFQPSGSPTPPQAA